MSATTKPETEQMNKGDTEKLGQAVHATQTDGMFYATPKEMESLANAGFVESNAEMKEGNKIAFRATQTGMDEFAKQTGAQPAVTTSGPAENTEEAGDDPQFEIEDIAVSPKRRRTGPKMKYPFDKLQPGQSFFVPASDKMKDPAKQLASTVATAQRRYAVEDGTRVNRKGETVPNYTPTRVFKLEPAERDGVKGARIGRVE